MARFRRVRKAFGWLKFWGKKKKPAKKPQKAKLPELEKKPEPKKQRGVQEMKTGEIITSAERIMAHGAYRQNKKDVLKSQDFKIHLNHTREIMKFRIKGKNMREKLENFLEERGSLPTRLDKRGNLLEQGVYDIINQALASEAKLKLLERYYNGESQWNHIRRKFTA